VFLLSQGDLIENFVLFLGITGVFIKIYGPQIDCCRKLRIVSWLSEVVIVVVMMGCGIVSINLRGYFVGGGWV
jgi:hypothetical protein